MHATLTDKTQFQIHRERMRDWALLWRRWVRRAPEAARFFIDMAVARRNLSVQSGRVADLITPHPGPLPSEGRWNGQYCFCGSRMREAGPGVFVCVAWERNPDSHPDRQDAYPTLLTFPAGASSSPAGCADPARSEGDQQRPPTDIEIAQLLQLFEMHSGFIPGRELTAEGFEIRDLIARQLIAAPRSHLDGGCYTVGTELVAAVRRMRNHVLSTI